MYFEAGGGVGGAVSKVTQHFAVVSVMLFYKAYMKSRIIHGVLHDI